MKASLATLTTKDLISAFEENEDIDDVIEMLEVKEGKNKKIFRKKELQAKKAELPQRIKVAAAGWGLGRYSTVAACARAYRVNKNLLYTVAFPRWGFASLYRSFSSASKRSIPTG